LRVRARRVDWRHDGAGRRVGFLAGVDGARAEARDRGHRVIERVGAGR
jgi:hypothetical protein